MMKVNICSNKESCSSLW